MTRFVKNKLSGRLQTSAKRKRPGPKKGYLKKKLQEIQATSAQVASETQAVRNDPSSSIPYFQYESLLDNVSEHPPVKQEILSDGESPSEDAINHSNVTFLPLKGLITTLRSHVPQPSTSVKVEPETSDQLPDPTPSLPVITDVKTVKPDRPNTNHKLPYVYRSVEVTSNEELDSFVASSLVDCQLGADSSVAADFRIESSSSLHDDAHSSSCSSPAGDEYELCDKCGSYTRKVVPATQRPKTNGYPHNNPTCAAMNNRLSMSQSAGSSTYTVGTPMAKFQAYGQLLGQRLGRLQKHTSTLVQNVIEEVMFNAEDGQYDGLSSMKGILIKRSYNFKALKQIGGFNGYDD